MKLDVYQDKLNLCALQRWHELLRASPTLLVLATVNHHFSENYGVVLFTGDCKRCTSTLAVRLYDDEAKDIDNAALAR